jgi:hypothetical protein
LYGVVHAHLNPIGSVQLIAMNAQDRKFPNHATLKAA